MQTFADTNGMSKSRRHSTPTSIREGDVKGTLPKGAQYNALKGMGYRPSDRDENRKTRKQGKQDLKRMDWE